MSNAQREADLYAAFGGGDRPTVLAGFTPDIEWREAEGNPYRPSGEPWVGPQVVLEQLFVRLGTEWDAFTVHVGTLHEAGDTVTMEGRYSGTFKPTGRSVDAQVCHVLRFRDGKLASFQQYVDTGQLQVVMATN